MATEQQQPQTASSHPPEEVPKDEDKAIIPHPSSHDHHKPLAIIIHTKPHEAAEEKPSEGSNSMDRDTELARVATEKRLCLIKAWEESEKSKAENKAQKKLSAISAWENSKKASIEAELRSIEEELEKKKAEYVEKMKNKIARIHKEAEEKRANIVATEKEELLKTEETAAKHKATGTSPKKLLGCF